MGPYAGSTFNFGYLPGGTVNTGDHPGDTYNNGANEQPNITVEKIQEPQLIRENLQGIHLITQLFPHVCRLMDIGYKSNTGQIWREYLQKRTKLKGYHYW